MKRHDWNVLLCAVNSALFFAHEVDSGFWREWELFRLPGGLAGFLAANVVLFLVVQAGLVAVVRSSRASAWWSALIASTGIVAAVVHGTFLAAGSPRFRETASVALLGCWLLTSLVQAVLVLTAASPASETASPAETGVGSPPGPGAR